MRTLSSHHHHRQHLHCIAYGSRVQELERLMDVLRTGRERAKVRRELRRNGTRVSKYMDGLRADKSGEGSFSCS